MNNTTFRILEKLREINNNLYIFFLSKKFGKIGKNVHISKKAIFLGESGISIGNNTKIFDHATIQCTTTGKIHITSGEIQIGNECLIQPFSYLCSQGGTIKIGNRCSVNPFSVIYGLGNVIIGNNVRIASQTIIVPFNHNFTNEVVPISEQGYDLKGITIDDDVWIGAGAKILAGVHISSGCVIGAGSVLTKSTLPGGVYCGVPAIRIKNRGSNNSFENDEDR